MNEKLSITLPAEMVAAIKEHVDAGRYASTSDMVRNAIQAWMRDEQDHNQRLAEIRAGIAQSLADTRPLLTSAEVDARLDALAARHGDHS